MPPLDSWEIISLDSEAADNAEKEASEVEQLRMTVSRFEEERKLMLDEISQLKEMLMREVNQAEIDKKSNMTIINDFKTIRQRLDTQLHAAKAELNDLKVRICFCVKVSEPRILRFDKRWRHLYYFPDISFEGCPKLTIHLSFMPF